jgi:hypothetical protein
VGEVRMGRGTWWVEEREASHNWEKKFCVAMLLINVFITLHIFQSERLPAL